MGGGQSSTKYRFNLMRGAHVASCLQQGRGRAGLDFTGVALVSLVGAMRVARPFRVSICLGVSKRALVTGLTPGRGRTSDNYLGGRAPLVARRVSSRRARC